MMGGYGYVEREFEEGTNEPMLKVVYGNALNPTIKRFYFPEWLNEWKRKLSEVKKLSEELNARYKKGERVLNAEDDIRKRLREILEEK